MALKSTASGLILFAHGARDARWAQPFEAVARACRMKTPGRPVALAYLEFMSPDLTEAGAQLAEQGCTEVAVLPLFLGAGGHVRRDLPAQVEALRTRHPQIRWTLHAAVGESPMLIETMAQIADALPADGPPPTTLEPTA
jgi:sirohydrochlorin cobaltochelatase